MLYVNLLTPKLNRTKKKQNIICTTMFLIFYPLAHQIRAGKTLLLSFLSFLPPLSFFSPPEKCFTLKVNKRGTKNMRSDVAIYFLGEKIFAA